MLGQLQGARVLVVAAGRTATGSILTVEERRSQADGNRTPLTTHALVIASEGGELMSFDLAEVRSVKLIDEGTRRDVNEFANASASARRRDAKTIVVTSEGAGPREMMVSYTIAAPIWKTTYRVVLDSQGKPFFQGWAIVDNVSEEDWNNISLSLVSGSPISFIQHIQKPFYRYRPVVPMPDDLKLEPQTYEANEGGGAAGTVSGRVTDPNGATVNGATVTITNAMTNQSYTTTTANDGSFRSSSLAPGNYSVRVSAPGFKQHLLTNVAVGSSWPAHANVTLEVGGISETVTVTAGSETYLNTSSQTLGRRLPLNGRGLNTLNGLSPSSGANTSLDGVSLSDAITRPDSGVETAATGSEVGDLFEYRIDQPVTVPRDRSALIPILQTRMEGERVSIYNEGVRRDRPFGGMLLKNTSPLTLEDGALTVIDGDAYAGEALMERLKPAEQRLISFALDLGTLVTVRTKDDRAPTFLVRAINGVFQAHYYQTSQKTYVLTNQTDKPRVVIIEHPVRQDWSLTSDTQKPEGKSARYYRFRVPLEPHQKVELPVTERRVLMDTYTLVNFTRQDLELFISHNYIDAATRAVLEKIIDVKSRIAAVETRLEAIDEEVTEIGKDQERLRDNIKALTATAGAQIWRRRPRRRRSVNRVWLPVQLEARRDDLDVVQLAVVLHADDVRPLDRLALDPRLRELVGHPVLEAQPGARDHDRDPGLLHLVLVRLDRVVDRLVIAILEVRAGAAEGGEAGGPRGHEHVPVGDPLRVAGDVQRPAAAVAEQRVVGRRVALAEDAADRLVSQRLLEQLDHPGRGMRHVEPERLGELATHLGLGALGVEVDVAAQEVVGVDAPEDQVEVGDRDRLEPALGPADADPRPGRVGAQLGPARVRVDANERAGAGADRVDLDQRDVEDEPGDVGRGRDLEAPVRDQRDVERRPADVGAEDVSLADATGQLGAADDAADRARDERARQLWPRSRSCRRAPPSPAARTRRRPRGSGRAPSGAARARARPRRPRSGWSSAAGRSLRTG